MTSQEQSIITRMELSPRASVRLFAILYVASGDHVKSVMRRDPLWVEYLTAA